MNKLTTDALQTALAENKALREKLSNTSRSAKPQNWNEEPDDLDEAYQKYKNAIYDAMVYADRYTRSLSVTAAKVCREENDAAIVNVARRAGHAQIAATIIRQLYVGIQ